MECYISRMMKPDHLLSTSIPQATLVRISRNAYVVRDWEWRPSLVGISADPSVDLNADAQLEITPQVCFDSHTSQFNSNEFYRLISASMLLMGTHKHRFSSMSRGNPRWQWLEKLALMHVSTSRPTSASTQACKGNFSRWAMATTSRFTTILLRYIR